VVNRVSTTSTVEIWSIGAVEKNGLFQKHKRLHSDYGLSQRTVLMPLSVIIFPSKLHSNHFRTGCGDLLNVSLRLVLPGSCRASNARQNRLIRISSLASSITKLSCSEIEPQLPPSEGVIIGSNVWRSLNRI
jgi:hypothetical protein